MGATVAVTVAVTVVATVVSGMVAGGGVAPVAPAALAAPAGAGVARFAAGGTASAGHGPREPKADTECRGSGRPQRPAGRGVPKAKKRPCTPRGTRATNGEGARGGAGAVTAAPPWPWDDAAGGDGPAAAPRPAPSG
ncbi:hypothetical protein GSF24_35875, partial [Microbispora triticiradicis]|nr:hypothetical protein [Microbispora triticiradicis]